MRSAVVSDKGGREYNEDFIGEKNVDNIHCFVLADGLGENGNGQIASKVAVNTVLECFESNPQITPNALRNYLDEAHKNVLKEGIKIGSSITTTIAVLITDGNSVIWAHCGDSRVYKIKKYKIQEISDDHSQAFKLFLRDKISYSDIRNSPEKNKLLRMLGESYTFNPTISKLVPVTSKDAFLLCSDGFWEYITEDLIEMALKKTSSVDECLDYMLYERSKIVPDNSDNFSAIMIYI